MAFGDRLAEAAVRIEREHREEARRSEARRLIQVIKSTGGTIELTGENDGIRVSPRPDDATAAILRAHKAALIEVLKVQART